MTDKIFTEPVKLSWGKFERYITFLFPSGTWRIGSIADGSCFFHSILTAINKNYRNIKNLEERSSKVEEVRNVISKKITLNTWENLQNGEPAHFSFLQQINDFEGVVVKVLKNSSKYKNSKSRKWIIDSITHVNSEIIINTVLGDSFFDMNDFSNTCSTKNGYITMSKCEDVFVKMQLKVYIKKIEKKLKKLTAKYNSGDIEASVLDYKVLLENVASNAKKSALLALTTHFANPSEWIGTEYLEFLSNQFNTNIFIINGVDGIPYRQGDTTIIKDGRSNIFLLNVGESHYETLGFEINNSDKPKIKCRLSWSHPIVQKIANDWYRKKNKSTEMITEKISKEESEEEKEESEEEKEESEEEKEESEEDIWMSEDDKDSGVFSSSENDDSSNDSDRED